MSGRTVALTARIVITLESIRMELDTAGDLALPAGGGRHRQYHLARCAVALMSPFASETLGVYLHADRQVEPRGHDCYVVAASVIVYYALGRLSERRHHQASFKQYVERPATLCIPVLLATFSVGNGAAIYRSDFSRCLPTSG
jgi:hypothetical protein